MPVFTDSYWRWSDKWLVTKYGSQGALFCASMQKVREPTNGEDGYVNGVE